MVNNSDLVGNTGSEYWLISPKTIVLWSLSIILLGATFFEEILALVSTWSGTEEYSHGFLIPFVSLYFVWQQKNELLKLRPGLHYTGVALLVLSVLVLLLGRFSTILIISQYGLLLAIVALFWTVLGWAGIRLIWAPLLLLAFTIPLPAFFYNNLSSALQLVSSEIGVAVIRLFDISVYLEGNVIDLGSYQLQVVEACSGLRYLFPLMSFGFICAYLFNAPFWQRALIFLSSIPVTVLMNSFRIGVIGVTVEYWGIEAAEGFLHDFEGWVVFMACTGVLFFEMWLLTKFFGDNRSLRTVFGMEPPVPLPDDVDVKDRPISPPMIANVGVLVVAIVVLQLLGDRTEEQIPREPLPYFPMQVDEWEGRSELLGQNFLDSLKLTDYVIADYVNDEAEAVNFYVAWYDSQRTGVSAHSPKSCIPGGGWRIADHTIQDMGFSLANGQALRVNRVEIQKGDVSQVVYYWFQQRGRIITNEYLVKWFIFWDSLTKNRSDGALVRLTTFVPEGESEGLGDDRLRRFALAVIPELDAYVPN